MKYQLLGTRTGLQVSEFALGTGRLGMRPDGTVDREAGIATLAAFDGAGGNFIDTSSAYLSGTAEILIGEFLKDRDRDQFVISSKYGRTHLADPARSNAGLHRKALAAEVDRSLKRLGTDRIDLYFPHFDDGVTPIEEIMRGLDDLVRSGKILYIGLSNFPIWRATSAVLISELRGWSPVAALQLQYNLLERVVEQEYLPLATAHGLANMAWSPFAGGKLARKNVTGQTESIVSALEAVAIEIGVSPSAVALSWLKRKGVIPVIGARDTKQLHENLAAVSIEMDDARLRELDLLTHRQPSYPYHILHTQQRKLGLDV